MPAIVHKVDFSDSANRSNGSGHPSPVRRKVIPFAAEPELLATLRPAEALPCCQRREGIAVVLLALGLHLAGFAWMPDAGQEEPFTAPAPIQVTWIALPRLKKEAPPAAPQKQQQPMNKPKPKPKVPKQQKARQKAVLSTSASESATKTSAIPAENITKTAGPSVTKSPETPAVKPLKTAVPPALSAPSAQAVDSRLSLILPNLNADYLDNPAPDYPEEARERGEQGKVLVRALINADGSVAQLKTKRSSGFPDLDRSALETVKKWRFVPARRGETTVSAWVVVPITFSLEG